VTNFLTRWLARRILGLLRDSRQAHQDLILHELQLIRSQLAQVQAASTRSNTREVESLAAVEFKAFSQFGEDGILNYICINIDLLRPRILEIGAGNYSEGNSRFLVTSRSGVAVLVDSDLSLESRVAATEDRWKGPVIPLSLWVSPVNIGEILLTAESELGGIDILSLDIDGNDYWVAEAIDFSRVMVVVVEYNPHFGAEMPVTVPRDDEFSRLSAHPSGLYYGASLRAWVDLLEARGFGYLGTNLACHNAFFVQSRWSGNFENLLARVDRSLQVYMDFRVRDVRGDDNKLNYLRASSQMDRIRDLPLIQTSTREQITVADVLGSRKQDGV
jgi:hypothetical protein